MASKRILMVFDFDHTLVDDNTDYHVIKLAPNEELPEEIKALYRDNGWIDYMGEIFKFLHQQGRSKTDILQCMSEIQFTDGMKELLELRPKDMDIETIIISDSNSVFIQHILDLANLSSSIQKVFTNPAEFDSQGCLTVKGYHYQEWCTLSSENLCKGHILETFLKEKLENSVEYSHIFYVGDGYNDLCPGLILRQQDFLMPRIGFKLDNMIQEMSVKNEPAKRCDLKASVVPWSSGLDIIKQLESLSK